jgi:hypothetical protein
MRGFFYVSGVCVAEGADGVGTKGLGDTPRLDVQTRMEVFLNMHLWACLFL